MIRMTVMVPRGLEALPHGRPHVSEADFARRLRGLAYSTKHPALTMWSERALRELIRLRLRSLLLPVLAAGRVWAGPGAGETCIACDESVDTSQIIYEWEDAALNAKFQMHVLCYEIWDHERLRLNRN